MPIIDLLLTGLDLMLVGMGIVFTFLVLLVFSMLAMSKFVIAIERRQAEQSQSVASSSPGQPSDEVRGDVVAVITAAITRYRASHG
jgi:oxaloacetate decarboxylase (Na+ extruding) subunit gamma